MLIFEPLSQDCLIPEGLISYFSLKYNEKF